MINVINNVINENGKEGRGKGAALSNTTGYGKVGCGTCSGSYTGRDLGIGTHDYTKDFTFDAFLDKFGPKTIVPACVKGFSKVIKCASGICFTVSTSVEGFPE